MRDFQRGPTRGGLIIAAGLAAGFAAACGGGHQLAEYDFSGRTVGVVSYAPSYPVLWTARVDIADPRTDPMGAVLTGGTSAATEAAGRRARARLDSAAARLDFADDLTARTLARTSRYLGARPSDDSRSADFLLEVNVYRFGIDGRDPDVAYLFIEAEGVLIDARNGGEIWHEEIRAWDRLTTRIRGEGDLPTGLATAAMLGSLSVEEFERVLRRLAEYSAQVITDELREDLRKVRRDRRG